MRTQLMAEARPQRRLAAILAADFVGYSRLMGADEAGTIAVLRDVWTEHFNGGIPTNIA
jgi:adenylate cyclase